MLNKEELSPVDIDILFTCLEDFLRSEKDDLEDWGDLLDGCEYGKDPINFHNINISMEVCRMRIASAEKMLAGLEKLTKDQVEKMSGELID